MAAIATTATVLIVPGMRDHVEQHWQTYLAGRLERVRTVPPMGRVDLDCLTRVAALEREAQAIDGPIVLVGHSGGVQTIVRWARRTKRPVLGALLATPADFEEPMPAGYPTVEELRANGWLPVPRGPLPFPAIVGASRNDPLASFSRVEDMAFAWGANLVDLGEVGHLNPASGYGPWPQAEDFITALILAARVPARAA